MCVVNKTRRFLAILVTVVTLVCMTGTIAYAEDDGGGDTGVTEYITSGLMKDQFNNLLSEINGESGFGADVQNNAILAPGSTLRKVWIDNEGILEKMYGVVFSIALSLSVAFLWSTCFEKRRKAAGIQMLYQVRHHADCRSRVDGIWVRFALRFH